MDNRPKLTELTLKFNLILLLKFHFAIFKRINSFTLLRIFTWELKAHGKTYFVFRKVFKTVKKIQKRVRKLRAAKGTVFVNAFSNFENLIALQFTVFFFLRKISRFKIFLNLREFSLKKAVKCTKVPITSTISVQSSIFFFSFVFCFLFFSLTENEIGKLFLPEQVQGKVK